MGSVGSYGRVAAPEMGAGDSLEGVAGVTIPPAGPQSLPEGGLGHPTVRNQALASQPAGYGAPLGPLTS